MMGIRLMERPAERSTWTGTTCKVVAPVGRTPAGDLPNPSQAYWAHP